MKQYLIKTLIILIIAKLISLGLLLLLPSNGVEQKADNSYTPKYQRVDFKNMLTSSSKEINKKSFSSNGTVITNMILKGLFGSEHQGYAIISLKSKPEDSSIISIGESFKGYKLKSILNDRILLIKNSKEYILKMQAVKSNNSSISYVKETSSEVNEVSKADINYYIKNPKQVWRDISISQINNPKGFKVTRVKKGSKMDKLGLKKGDIIIKANNTELKSLKNVMSIYKNIQDTTAIEIVVLRNNTEMELSYEIY